MTVKGVLKRELEMQADEADHTLREWLMLLLKEGRVKENVLHLALGQKPRCWWCVAKKPGTAMIQRRLTAQVSLE